LQTIDAVVLEIYTYFTFSATDSHNYVATL